jgi:AraC-like DNA-binding protein
MGGYFWDYSFEPDFPLNILPFTTKDAQDTIHWHNYLQLCLCTGGTGQFIFTNREYSVEKGDIFIVGNFENHVAVSESAPYATFLFVIFLPEFIAYPGSREFDFEYLYPFRYNPENFDNKIAAGNPLSDEIGRIILEMNSSLESRMAGYKHVLDASLRRILALLINYYQTNYKDYHYENKSHAKIQKAINYINNNFQNNLTLDEISEKFFISKSRFRHLFKETVRIGFKEYITYLRLTNARRLLLTTDLSISEVANQAGFSNIHQFYKVFHQYVSLLPADYRKQYRQKT